MISAPTSAYCPSARPSRRVNTRPPTRSRASSTTTSCSRDWTSVAATSPDSPAPTTSSLNAPIPPSAHGPFASSAPPVADNRVRGGHPPSVYHDRLTRDVTGLVRGQEQDGAGDLSRLAHALERSTAADRRGIDPALLDQLARHRSRHVAGSNRVDTHGRP